MSKNILSRTASAAGLSKEDSQESPLQQLTSVRRELAETKRELEDAAQTTTTQQSTIAQQRKDVLSLMQWFESHDSDIQSVRTSMSWKIGNLVADILRKFKLLPKSTAFDHIQIVHQQYQLWKTSCQPRYADPLAVDTAIAVAIAVDAAIAIADAGIFLNGWCMVRHQDLDYLLLVNETTQESHKVTGYQRYSRKDITKAFEVQSADNNHGFFCFVPAPLNPSLSHSFSIQAVTRSGAIAKAPVQVKTIPNALELSKVLFAALDFNSSTFRERLDLLAPLMRLAWQARSKPEVTLVEKVFGTVPAAPLISIIVPLYGRYDFLQLQLALFADDPDFAQVELIYVVDDPAIYADVLNESIRWQPLFKLPFKILYGGHNLGYAGANNLGVSQSRGKYLLLLNSDVMPKSQRWLHQLVTAYEGLNQAGALSPTLLYEDNSIQHAGMQFVRHPFWGGLWINEHPHKGLPPNPMQNLHPVPVQAVTAACLFMERDIYLSVGGFDEDYILGDFEDSDLCLKLSERGLSCYCAPNIELYHLERQSQNLFTDNTWRNKLTVYNCWLQSQKWDAKIEQLLLSCHEPIMNTQEKIFNTVPQPRTVGQKLEKNSPPRGPKIAPQPKKGGGRSVGGLKSKNYR